MLHSLKHSEEPNVAAGRTSRGLEAAISTAAQPAPSGWYRVSNRRGDFWLVDDDWGGHLQKVCVFRIGFVTRRLVSDVQALLDSEFSDWGVMIQLEINDSSESIPPEGLIVYADSVEEAWDAEQLVRVFGKKVISASQLNGSLQSMQIQRLRLCHRPWRLALVHSKTGI